MTDYTTLELPEPRVEAPRRWRPSLIWAVPILAALIGLGLVFQAFWQHGPVVTVSFLSAQGIEPGKTKVRFKDVEVGEVRAVRLAKDRSRVLVTVDLAREAREFAATDSRFWVVRPRLAGSAISGLETVLSGSYIGVDGGRSGEYRDEFTGLEEPPVVASDVPGRRFFLRASDIGSLDVGSPVYFRRIRVGHVEAFSLQPDGSHIRLGVFVNSPYDQFITKDTRFWHASGVDLKVDASGFRIETQSLATILMGGVAFETPDFSGDAAVADDGAEFNLAASYADAIKQPDGEPATVLLRFRQSIRGLSVGAPVDFRGVEIGQVRSVAIEYDPASDEFNSPVVVDIYPDRLSGVDPGHKLGDGNGRRTIVADLVRRGLRAQLQTGNFLTGQLYVRLDFFPDVPAVRFDPRSDPLELPTIPGDLQELQRQLQAIVQKLDRLPLDQLADDAHRTLVALEAALKRVDKAVHQTDNGLLPEVRALLPEIRDGLRDMRRTMDGLQQTLAPDAPLQQDSRAALQDLGAVARSLKSLTDTLEKHPESLLRGKSRESP